MKFKWKYEHYNPYQLQQKPYEEVKKEYRRLRKNVGRRMKVFEKHGYERAEVYRKFMETKPLSKIKNATELSYNLSYLAKIQLDKLSSYKGQKEYNRKVLESLHEHGYEFVNQENIWDFVDYMEEFKDQALDELYDSKTATAIFEKVKNPGELEKVKNNFEYYLERQKNKKPLNLSRKGEKLNESDISERD